MMRFGKAASRRSPSAKKEDQKGFTLIEMSIVLAIIGLIVGGILKGQEVVNNARLKTQVAQIDAIKSAVYTFQDQYNYLPGDYALSSSNLGFTTSADGDGNGAIAAKGNLSMLDTATEQSTEAVLAWAHLVAGNLLAGIQLPANTQLSAITNTTALYYPGKMNNTYLWLATFSSTPPSGVATTATMVRMQAVSTGTITANSPPYALRESDAANIDRKYDDGSPLTGSIISPSTSDTTNCVATKAYTLSSTGSPNNNYCNLMFVVQ